MPFVSRLGTTQWGLGRTARRRKRRWTAAAAGGSWDGGGGRPCYRPPTCQRRWQRSEIGASPLSSRQALPGGLGLRRLPAREQGSGNRTLHAPRRVQGGFLRHGFAWCPTRFAGQMAQQRAMSACKPVACGPEREKSDTTEPPKTKKTIAYQRIAERSIT